MDKKEKIIGCLLGTATGDSMGLPAEGLSRRRINRIFGNMERQNFFFGKGMCSDDTEHTIMVAESLLESKGDVRLFIKKLSWKMRFWFLCLPAGIGLATLRACIKLCLGFPGEKSGVYSAGNGPAMRSAIIGILYGNDPEKMKKLVEGSTRITHRDPKAFYGSLAVALAAHMADKDITPEDYYGELEKLLGKEGEEFLSLIKKVMESISKGNTTGEFLANSGYGHGVKGYIYHTVPAVLHTWFRHRKNYKEGLLEIIKAGGDTDTTGAILGGIIGAGAGKEGIPKEWLGNIWEWPKSVSWMCRLGENLAEPEKDNKVPHYNYFLILPRNILFTIIVLFHGFRRIFPPY